jgi:3-oxoacyl-[acyl-carrier protein] reductase
MELGLRGKVAIVTGGATGIGRAIVRALVSEGVLVSFSSRNKDAGLKLSEELGAAVNFVNLSPLPEDGPAKIYKASTDVFGKADIVINNVGDTLGIIDPMCSIDDWRRVFRLNLEVHVEMNNAALPHMINKGWGRIVNITAGAGLENSGPVPYSAIKSAYTAYTRSMARVVAPQGVVMSAVLPGVVLTEEGHWSSVLSQRPEHAAKYLDERTVLKRFGQPDEISPFVVLLCSNLASFAVGSIVPVEGGQARHFFAGNLEAFA